MNLTTASKHISKVETEALFKSVFDNLVALYPSIKSQLDASQFLALKKQWVIALRENGINSTGLLKAGFARARREKREFLPPVGVFIEWCRQEYMIQQYQIPTVNCLIIALRHYAAVKGLAAYRANSLAEHYLVAGLYAEMRSKRLSEEKLATTAQRMIETLIDKLLQGFVIPDMSRSLESSPTYSPVSSERALQRIQALKQMIHNKQQTAQIR